MEANCSWVLSCVSVQQQVSKKKKKIQEASKNVFNMDSKAGSIFKKEEGFLLCDVPELKRLKACASALTRMPDSARDSGS